MKACKAFKACLGNMTLYFFYMNLAVIAAMFVTFAKEAQAGSLRIIKNQPQILDVDTYLELVALVDSRCPKDVTCFWEGNIEATFTLIKDNTKKKFDLVLHANQPTIAEVSSFRFCLQKVEPYPSSTDHTSDQSVVTLEVERTDL